MATNIAIRREDNDTFDDLFNKFKSAVKKENIKQQVRDHEHFRSNKEKDQDKRDRHKAMLQSKKRKNQR